MPDFTRIRNKCRQIKLWIVEAVEKLCAIAFLIIIGVVKCWLEPVRRFELPGIAEQQFKVARVSESVPLTPNFNSALASEFVMGVVSAPASGDVAKSLARLLVSSKVRCPPHASAVI